jgi:CubicO group peptidase (beta-lactamase class C family)
MSPAFGLFTTANDLARLARFLLGYGGDAVLSAAMRERMLTRQSAGWGLGLRIGRLDGNPVARHGGWFAAHKSHLLLDLGNELSVVVMTNGDSGDPTEIAEALYRAARESSGLTAVKVSGLFEQARRIFPLANPQINLTPLPTPLPLFRSGYC